MANYHSIKNAAILTPTTNTDLGSDANRYANVYMSGNIVMSNGVTVTSTNVITPKISAVTYPDNDTAADTVGGQTITITGSGFSAGASVLLGTTPATVVTVISGTSITFTSPTLTAGNYALYVINSDGGTAIYIPGIAYSGTPTWSTTSGSVATVYETNSISSTVTATGDATISYSLNSGTLPTGSTLNSSTGLISGTAPASAGSTTYSFVIRATDGQNQDTNRSFTITVNTDAVTWSSPADNASTSLEVGSAMSAVTLNATSAAGKSITYTANALPTGLSISSNTVVGTPTVVGSTTSLITATAATTGRTATRTLSWVVSVGGDTYFPYTTLLLSGNGTNNAQNNTFLDGSTNNFAITRNGNTTQGTFSPYGSNWSNYLAGAGNYFQTPASSASTIVGTLSNTANLTIECWIYPTAYNSSANFPGLIGDMVATIENNNWSWGITNTGTLMIYWNVSGSQLRATSTNAVSLNTWTHIALNVAAGAITMYINGVVQSLSGTTTLSTPSGSTGYLIIGQWNNGSGGTGGTSHGLYTGYISNLRVVKASTYTSSFTPSTTPLTAIANTSLLYCQSNRFKDNSTNNLAITLGGSPTVQRFSPFSPTATYSTSTIGGSAYFDGTGDYLTTPQNAAFNFGTGAFTVEAWVYLTAYPSGGSSSIFSLGNGAAGGSIYTGWGLTFTSTTINFYRYDGGEPNYAAATAIPLNTWSHVVAVRNGSSSLSIYLNGARILNTTSSVAYNNVNSDNLHVGYWRSGDPQTTRLATGYYSDGRIVKGTAVYDPTLITLTVPTAPLTAVSGTQLLLNYTNAGIIDNTMINNLETVGNAQISTAQSKFGGSSMYFDGSGDYLYIPTSANQNLGNTWTVECWYYPVSKSNSYPTIFGISDGNPANSIVLNERHDGAGTKFSFSVGSYALNSSTTNVANGTWYHIALVSNNGVVTMYVNGISEVTANLTAGSSNKLVYIGANYDYATYPTYLNGYINDLRITRGYARYTSNFAAPTSAFNLK